MARMFEQLDEGDFTALSVVVGSAGVEKIRSRRGESHTYDACDKAHRCPAHRRQFEREREIRRDAEAAAAVAQHQAVTTDMRNRAAVAMSRMASAPIPGTAAYAGARP